MSIYKKASKQKLRVQTAVGNLSVEQLWDLEVEQLDALAVSLEEEYKSSGKKSFLTVSSKKDKEAKLKFDIVLDILQTKIAIAEKASKAYETRQFNARIDELIAKKQETELESKDIDELLAMKK